MDEGFILSNKYRKAVLYELASGEYDIGRIAKKHHIIPMIVRRVVDEFVEGGVLEKNGSRYILTRKGEKLVMRIGKQ
ncbi:MAG: hypothetical protein DRN08_02950 [Thermoplasmata archaeon]|nr:MAG: hypothetical protein DRN08_02950 [Thermoplasmata archaeon]